MLFDKVFDIIEKNKLELVLPDNAMSTEHTQAIQDFINKHGISIVIMKGIIMNPKLQENFKGRVP